MNSPYVFTYIIGYRHKPDRLNNLRKTLDWINSFSNVEVLLIEQDKHSKIEDLNLKCKHIFIKSEMPYNRSWAFNVGLKYSQSNAIVFGDSDLIMHPDDFIKGINSLSEYEMVSPYHSVIDLTPEESNLNFNNIIQINRPGRGETDNQKINISGGIAMFRKDAIEKIAGWNEQFIGWGGEDDFQTIKVKNLLTWTELKAKCYHFWHQREQPDMTYYQRSLQLLNQSQKLTKEELISHINNTSKKIGMKNLYDK
jgi:predicted glycosyltransferase involved in capsule biosynthesis